MGKIAMFLPKEEMLEQAHELLQEIDLDVSEILLTDTKNVLTEAKQVAERGVSIIISRGLQSVLLKKYTDMPVVDITMSAQEMALLVVEAKRIVDKKHPRIGLVGFANMFCDMSHFNELYDVDFRTYFVENSDELQGQVQRAVHEHCDLVMGGEAVLVYTEQYKIASLYLTSTKESMRQALEDAQRMDYAMSVEKRSSAQLEALIDYSDNGIIQTDPDGKIVSANVMIENLIGRDCADLTGRMLFDVFPDISQEILVKTLSEGRDYSTQFRWDDAMLFTTIAPIMVNDKVDGAFVTCHRVRRPQAEGPSKPQEDNMIRRSSATAQFSDIMQDSPVMQECILTATLFAYSDQPVILRGEPGTERRLIAECIHNNSSRKSGPFLDIPCKGLGDAEQWSLIFGENGAALKAHGGTLLLRDLDELSPANQYRLYQLIRFHICYGVQTGSFRKLDVRVIAMTPVPLAQLLREGKLRKDLFYLLSGLELTIPPLRERKEDLDKKLTQAFRKSCAHYSHYHILTEGAKAILRQYPWPGNIFQIDSFMDRIVLLAKKRVFDETLILQQLKELYPDEIEVVKASTPESAYAQLQESRQDDGDAPKFTMLVDTEEAERIQETLRLFCGNREKTAKALGMSKVTLWRHMKKYGIEV